MVAQKMGSSIDIMVGAISLIICWDFILGLNKAGVQPSWLIQRCNYFDFVINACTFFKQPNKFKNVPKIISSKLESFLLVPIYWLVVFPETKLAALLSTIQEINRYPLKNLYFPLKVYDDAL